MTVTEATTRKPEYPEKQANAITWEYKGCTLTIIQPFPGERYLGHWCGYVRIPNWPEQTPTTYNDEPMYSLNVHGGVTYTESGSDGSLVVGFDCAHLHDDTNPLTSDETWLRAETERMTDQLLSAIKVKQ